MMKIRGIIFIVLLQMFQNCSPVNFTKGMTPESKEGFVVTPPVIVDPTPTPSPRPTATPSPRPSGSPNASPTPTPTPTSTPTPTPAPTPTPTPIPTPTPTPIPTPIPSPTPCAGVVKDPNNCISAVCLGGVQNPRVYVTWCNAPNANSNGLEKGDMHPNDPERFWDWLYPGDAHAYLDYQVQAGVTYSYRYKPRPEVWWYYVTLPINACTCGNY